MHIFVGLFLIFARHLYVFFIYRIVKSWFTSLMAVYVFRFFFSSLARRHRLLVFVAGFVSRSIDNCGRLLRRVWQLFCRVNRTRSWVVVCPLRLVGRWVPLDFLLLYTCPLQLLDYFGGVRRGSGRGGRAARRLPEAGLALLSPPSPPRLNRVASSARRCRIISLSLYSCLHLLILTYTILYNNTGQTIVLALCERVDALVYTGDVRVSAYTGSHLRYRNYPAQITYILYSVLVAQFRCRCTVHGKDIGIVFLVLYCPAV